jgi:hypothetical protein
MDEHEGCAVLKRRFTAAGLSIEESYPLREGDVAFNVDGFDPQRRVGYEYITTAAGDREEITPALIAALEERMARAELFVLLVDEAEAPTEETLIHAADHFLMVLRMRGYLADTVGSPPAEPPKGRAP